MADDRTRLRTTFDSAADRYQSARPDYPDALYDALADLAGLRAGDRLLEVGCATGKATAPLARRGFAVTCVELGPELAAAARRNLAAFGQVEVIEGAFESWCPPDGERFDLVFAATAWHWIDPAVKYQKAASLLRPGGHLAFWEAVHVVPDGGDPFFLEIQDVYDAIGSGLPSGHMFARPDTLASAEEEIAASGLFRDISVRRFDWEITYTAESYIRLLETFSSNLTMEPWQRERLYGEIRARLAARPDGQLRRHWGAVLHVARTAE